MAPVGRKFYIMRRLDKLLVESGLRQQKSKSRPIFPDGPLRGSWQIMGNIAAQANMYAEAVSSLHGGDFGEKRQGKREGV